MLRSIKVPFQFDSLAQKTIIRGVAPAQLTDKTQMLIIEKDGQRYVGDKDGKVLEEDGKPVVYDPAKHKDADPDLSALELETLAKANPHVARVLQEKQEAEAKAKELAEAEEKKRQEEAQKKGEFQKLYEEATGKLKERDGELGKLKESVKSYSETIDTLLNQMLEQVPKEKQALIPADYSSKKKLEYILANAAALGAETVLKKGSEVPKNDKAPVGDEAKLVAEIEELTKKANRTPTENTLMWEKAKQLKELRAAKQNK